MTSKSSALVYMSPTLHGIGDSLFHPLDDSGLHAPVREPAAFGSIGESKAWC